MARGRSRGGLEGSRPGATAAEWGRPGSDEAAAEELVNKAARMGLNRGDEAADGSKATRACQQGRTDGAEPRR